MTREDDTGAATPAYGRWLREQRKKLGLSQTELARRAGISSVQVCNIETGRTKNPLAKTRHRLSLVFAQADNVDSGCDIIDMSQKSKQAPQQDGGELSCSFCKRPLAEAHSIAWLSDERDVTACQDCVDKLNSIFACAARADRYDGTAKLRLVPKTTAKANKHNSP